MKSKTNQEISDDEEIDSQDIDADEDEELEQQKNVKQAILPERKQDSEERKFNTEQD